MPACAVPVFLMLNTKRSERKLVLQQSLLNRIGKVPSRLWNLVTQGHPVRPEPCVVTGPVGKLLWAGALSRESSGSWVSNFPATFPAAKCDNFSQFQPISANFSNSKMTFPQVHRGMAATSGLFVLFDCTKQNKIRQGLLECLVIASGNSNADAKATVEENQT